MPIVAVRPIESADQSVADGGGGGQSTSLVLTQYCECRMPNVNAGIRRRLDDMF